MNFSAINWLAVVACVVVSMISGTIWYNPKTFFPVWWKGIGKSDKDTPGTSNMAMTWGLTVLASLVQAVAMALMVNAMGGLIGGASHGPSKPRQYRAKVDYWYILSDTVR